MPGKKKSYSKKKRGYGYRKRPYYKKRHYGTNKISVVKSMGKPGFPDEFMCKLQYITNGTFAGGVSSPASQVFYANNLFDPDVTSTGHQPLYYDQLTAVYGKYLVLGCAFNLEFTNGASSGAYISAAFNEVDTSSRSVESIGEMRYSYKGVIGPVGGMSNKNMRGYLSMAKLHGQKRIDSDSSQYALVSGGPSDQAFFFFRCQSVDGTNANLNWRCTMTYYCKFKDLQNPSQS